MTVNTIDFSFSDLVAGYVSGAGDADGGIDLTTVDGRRFRVRLAPTVSAQFLRNLGEPYVDATAHIDEMVAPGRLVFAYGTFYPPENSFVSTRLIFLGRRPGEYRFEEAGWWQRQIGELAAFYRRAQFGDTADVDFADYRTHLRLGGDKTTQHVQETDTISRFVYGMATSYLLTGEQDYLNVAERGTEYLRDHMRFVDRDEEVTYWYHGIDVRGRKEHKLFGSEFGDDFDALPAYEQIYALAGPTQLYRITGDRAIAEDIEGTLRLFDRFYRDKEHGGYFSHIDPILLSPRHDSLGGNRARKNWNSVGDHAPAYLINLLLATGEERHLSMLEETFDLICEHFPRDDSPFVQERFLEDWTPDPAWAWQQDRAVVGHNMKIAWNLMRMYAVRPKQAYLDLAEHLARSMPEVGSDRQRLGWYDVVERVAAPEGASQAHRFVWHDRKAWWQQEQAILAQLVLAGNRRGDDFAAGAREAQSFYNAFFLDHDEGGVYFNVLAEGTPYLLGNERLKGSHSMSMYHSAELCYLAAVYGQLLVQGEPLDLWFRPRPDGFPGRTLRVAPDALPPGRVVLGSVLVDGEPTREFDAEAMTVALPDAAEPVTVQVRLTPTEK